MRRKNKMGQTVTKKGHFASTWVENKTVQPFLFVKFEYD
jgi:hypothetical protein